MGHTTISAASKSGRTGDSGRTREESRETMTSNGEDTGGAHQSASGADGGTDVVRDLLLSLATNIDTIASMFAPPGHPAARPSAGADVTAPTTAGGVPFASSTSGVDGQAGAQVPIGDYLAEASGEIATLLVELGDLLARLLTALIAVLEAVVRALQADSAQPSGPRVHTAYAPITVRVNRGSAT